MATLELNIDALKYPDTGKAEKTTLGKSLLGMLQSLKCNFKPPRPDPAIPREYLPSDYKVFLILRDFLQPDSTISLSNAVDRVIEVFPDGYSNLRSINTVCFELAEQIPYYHSSHLKLARLLWLIGRSRKRIVRSGLKDTPAAVNAFYQHLGEDLVDNRSDPGDDGADPARYIKYQAFLANLMEVGIWLPGPNIALDAMRGAFEQSHEGESPAIRDAWVLGAAQWILWNGQGLFKLLLWPGDTYISNEHGWQDPDRADEKMEETAHITLRNWYVWKDGFREIADSDGVGEECKSVARKAATMMDVLEGGMSF